MRAFFQLLTLLIFLTCRAQNTDCFGEVSLLERGSYMPYAEVSVAGFKGYFLLDFGTTSSTIDPNGFLNGIPKSLNSNFEKFDNFNFYGSWGTVLLDIQNHSNIKSIQQAGILGTDILSKHIYTIDYSNKKLYRAHKEQFCSDSLLILKGFKPVSTAGYFSNDYKKLNNGCTPNIPSIPIKIGGVTAIAQIDPGYDDAMYNYAVNINQAYFDALKAANISLIENSIANFVLSTCTNVSEKVIAYKLPEEVNFSVTTTDGSTTLIHSDINIFLKQTPVDAISCGGIGAWKIPAAQLGASFLVNTKKVIFDPFSSKVWFYHIDDTLK